MKYYRLRNSIENKEIGHYHQVQKTTWDGRPYDDGAFGTQGLFNPIHSNPAIPTLEFYKSTKTTSLIHMVEIPIQHYLIINEPFLAFLKPYCNGPFQTWKIKATKKEVDYTYYIFYLDEYKSDFINYDKSIFKLFELIDGHEFKELNQEIKITSDIDYLDKCRNYGFGELQPTKIVLNTSNQEIDFFRCAHNGMAGYYVSERLKQAILDNSFTGMRFEEIEEIQNRVLIEYV
ncbi:hypothetical protein [Flavobacterium polysaccharolyticum]|uniref:RES domain-containing protein n=1 Tax=Flavobacterium polysaccharolyticum TaxID=3133148 RepID=A0ABU9NT88_9FLAO